jgi:hypothetical protein
MLLQDNHAKGWQGASSPTCTQNLKKKRKGGAKVPLLLHDEEKYISKELDSHVSPNGDTTKKWGAIHPIITGQP